MKIGSGIIAVQGCPRSLPKRCDAIQLEHSAVERQKKNPSGFRWGFLKN